MVTYKALRHDYKSATIDDSTGAAAAAKIARLDARLMIVRLLLAITVVCSLLIILVYISDSIDAVPTNSADTMAPNPMTSSVNSFAGDLLEVRY